MLYEFLVSNREKILAETKRKSADIAEQKTTTAVSERGLPQFYDHLIEALKRVDRGVAKETARRHGRRQDTFRHGRELQRLGYTISQVVHGYGVLCQAITELAAARRVAITTEEFNALNLTLDTAIAEAVTGFSIEHDNIGRIDAKKQMGFLVHELRNALTSATIASSMIKKGVVGTGGSTNALLERNLARMRDLLDRSFSEVRLMTDSALDRRPTLLVGVLEEIEGAAKEQARVKGLDLEVAADHELMIDVDRNYMVSALSNLVQNAIKYTKPGGRISVRAWETKESVVISVEDQCGGLPRGKTDELFQPFTKKSSDRSGLGLGLTICRRIVVLHGGALKVRDIPGKGCVFAVIVPKRARTRPPEPARTAHRHRR